MTCPVNIPASPARCGGLDARSASQPAGDSANGFDSLLDGLAAPKAAEAASGAGESSRQLNSGARQGARAASRTSAEGGAARGKSGGSAATLHDQLSQSARAEFADSSSGGGTMVKAPADSGADGSDSSESNDGDEDGEDGGAEKTEKTAPQPCGINFLFLAGAPVALPVAFVAAAANGAAASGSNGDGKSGSAPSGADVAGAVGGFFDWGAAAGVPESVSSSRSGSKETGKAEASKLSSAVSQAGAAALAKALAPADGTESAALPQPAPTQASKEGSAAALDVNLAGPKAALLEEAVAAAAPSEISRAAASELTQAPEAAASLKAARTTETETTRPRAGNAQARLGSGLVLEGVGTSAAPQAVQMSLGEQQNEFAGAGKQFLPARRNSNPGAAEVAGESGSGASLKTALLDARGTEFAAAVLSGSEKIETASPSAESQPLMTRLAASLGQETVNLRQFNADKLAVVLRPDAATQISVELRRVNDTVVASARCDRGDFGHLNAHWGELQRAMDLQGVRLSPLEDSGASASFLGNGAFGNSAQTPYERRARRLEERVLPMAGIRRAQTGEGLAAVDNNGSDTEKSLLQTWA